MSNTIKVTIWNEYRHEKNKPEIAKLYPEGIHGAVANYLKNFDAFEVRTAVLDDEEQGLTAEVLDNTDVLLWWGHMAHTEVKDEIVDRVYQKVLCGMGLIALHSAHMSKIFIKLMGTSCTLKWREAGEKERLWVVEPNHPIAKDLGAYFELTNEEMYGERFDIPTPDDLVFVSWFQGGEVFRSGCCYKRGLGKIFYFRPGHETYPTFYNQDVLKVIKNAIEWANPIQKVDEVRCAHSKPLEKIEKSMPI